MSRGRIMYVCTSCADGYPEACGHDDRTELRVMPDGDWLCDTCYDEVRTVDMPPWQSLPPPPEYKPTPDA